MLIARLIDVETKETVTADVFPDADAVARENARAQAETEGRQQWEAGEEVAPPEAFEMFAFLVCVDFSGGKDE